LKEETPVKSGDKIKATPENSSVKEPKSEAKGTESEKTPEQAVMMPSEDSKGTPI
jgi:hypothetical protein